MNEPTITLKTPRCGRRSEAKPFRLTPPHERILTEAMVPYHWLKAIQITALLYPTPKLGMLTTVQSRLSQLVTEQYLQVDPLPTKTGQRPLVYALGKQGRKFLRQKLGMTVRVYHEPARFAVVHKDHCLELNDFLLLAATLSRYAPHVTVADLEHALLFERAPLTYLEEFTGTLKTIKPDALFTLHSKRMGRSSLHLRCWVELDRGFVGDEQLMRKFRAIYDFIKRGYLAQHDGCKQPGPVRVFVVTTGGEQQVERLRRLFRREFPTLNPARGTNQLFKFGSIPPHGTTHTEKPLPPAVFFQPYWTTAYGDPGRLQTILVGER